MSDVRAWRSYRIYYSDLERLLIECVYPFLRSTEGRVHRRVCERHYLGGEHLRIRVCAAPEMGAVIGAELLRVARRYLAERPSADAPGYSERRATALAEREGIPAEPAELPYRNNLACECADVRRPDAYASEQAAVLADDFHHDMLPLVVDLITGARPRRERILQIYFLHALMVCEGDLPAGCVSMKSHWEGFAASCTSPELLARIRAMYEAQRSAIECLMLVVVRQFVNKKLEDSALLTWHDLLTRYRARVRDLVRAGVPITRQPTTLAEARRGRDDVFGSMHRESEFVRALWADERFMASIQHERGFLEARALINLLYELVAASGLSPLDRLALCHHAHRAAEDHYGCDLTDVLRRTMTDVIGRHNPSVPHSRVDA